jgi:hypothetical protein
MNPTQKGGKVPIQYVKLGPRATQHQITGTLINAMSWQEINQKKPVPSSFLKT